MPTQQTSGGVRERSRVREPRKYKVIIHNDDFTTMEFVVKVLTSVFFKTEEEATAMMLKVHNEGQAVVGAYCYDLAASRVRSAVAMARRQGFPLRFSIIPE